jgi:phosphoglycolate phosphatase-like HAD superfamily hydrolase
MKCTNCNNSVKPVVAIDIDGTLGDHHNHFMAFATRYVGHSLGPHRDKFMSFFEQLYPYDQEFSEWLGLPKDLYRDIKLAYRQGGMKRLMPVFTGAYELTHNLRNMGAEVWLCTTRPYLRLDNIDPDTREWCRRHRIAYDGLVYGEDKYERLAQIVGTDRVVCVLDDLPEMIDAANELALPTLQKQNGHMGSAVRQPGVTTLVEADRRIQGYVQDWFNRHEMEMSDV